VPHLDDLLVLASREDWAAAMRAFAEVAKSQYQSWAASQAYLRIIQDILEQANCLDTIAETTQKINWKFADTTILRELTLFTAYELSGKEGTIWLPDDLTVFDHHMAELLSSILNVSGNVNRALAATDPYTYRLWLCRAHQHLLTLQKRAQRLEETTFWDILIQQWFGILTKELHHPPLKPDQMLPLWIARAKDNLAWLQEDLSVWGLDTVKVLPPLLAIAHHVSAALASDSLYNRRLGFIHAQEDLHTLRQQLLVMGDEAVHRWQSVVDQWMHILDRELERSLLEPGATSVNPYDAGNPLTVHRAVLFRGRHDLTDAVARALLESNRPTLVLYGPRRMGKTSFLLQLPRLLPGRAVPVFVDLQRADATDSTARFLYTVARAIVNDARSHSRLTLPALEEETFERKPFAAFADWLDEVALPAMEKAGGFTLLLSFDEFEKLGQALEMKRMDERVLDELRHTIQHREAISLLFAGVQTLEELGPRWSSYFISVRPLRITYLRPEEAADLIRNPDPESGFNLEYADEAVEDILTATRCHPYLVQLVCSAVVNLANEQRTLLATPELVRDAQTAALAMGEPYFRNVWDESTGIDADTVAAGRAILWQVAWASGPVVVAADTSATPRALERLLRHDVLERGDDGVQFQVPLVQRWVRERAPMG
jgi:AAA+ ATPase superfamily predicted ATPase